LADKIKTMLMENFNAANEIQDLQYFGEFGGVNPSISDSSTYTFLSAKTMFDTFEGNAEGCYLVFQTFIPNESLSGTGSCQNGKYRISQCYSIRDGSDYSVLMQACKSGDHIISSRTIYGGTYAFLKNFLPQFNVATTFVDINNFESIENAITPSTKVIYCESVSNPLLEVADLRKLSEICKKHNLKLIVDNTFSPLSISPQLFGADVVIHSLTKFINGSSDTVGGVYCASQSFIDDTKNVNSGACMLLGPTMDSLRASSILKNLRTLHIRIKQHSHNAMYLAEKFEKDGLKVSYPDCHLIRIMN
jgi:methionine-gamma-lyase